MVPFYTGLGVIAAGACDVGTAGVCALGNPLIVSGSGALGGVVGGLASNATCHLGNILDDLTWCIGDTEANTGEAPTGSGGLGV